VRRTRYLVILLAGLVFLAAAAAVAARPLYLAATEGRPLCLPALPRRGDDSPQPAAAIDTASAAAIPSQEDWVDYGPVLETGVEGEWDFYWAGITPASVVKKDGTIFFYYVAADGYRSFDGDARHRSVGVATSRDGIRFTKYGGNPIMEHRPYDGEEEGANSAAITLDENGRFVMVYGAASGPHSSIVADARYAYSANGLDFTDAGRALYHCDLSLYGAGDEIFPVALLRQPDRWVVFYHPNGVRGSERTLGAAWGTELDRLTNSTVVLDGDSGGWPVGAWGNLIALDGETLLMFSQRLWWPDTFVEARLLSPATPYHPGEPLVRYDIPNLKRGVVFLDEERRTWFLYYNDFSRYWYVKLAPFGEPDSTPPSTPVVSARPAGESSVNLSWQDAVDPDTGVVAYRIYRNGIYRASTHDTSWRDEQLRPGVSYRYRVTAVNFHGAESPAGVAEATTLPDRTPPALMSAVTTGDLASIRLTFNEAVDRRSATEPSRYQISGGIHVESVRVAANGYTVLLQTTEHEPDAVYGLTVRGLSDLANVRNTMPPETIRYTASAIPGLAGRWLAGGRSGVDDLSGYGADGEVHGATLDASGALLLVGSDDYVQIPGRTGQLRALTSGSFALAAWVRPDGLPASPQGARIFGRVGEHPASFAGLSLSIDGRFEASSGLEDDSRISVQSEPVTMGQWYHLVMIVDAKGKAISLFVDGIASQESPKRYSSEVTNLWPESPRDDRSGAYYIGSTMPDRGAGAFFDAYFQGAIRDVRLYSRALGVDDIQVILQE
jgi:hypothetical protein